VLSWLEVNLQPALITRAGDRAFAVLTIEGDAQRIRTICIIANPRETRPRLKRQAHRDLAPPTGTNRVTSELVIRCQYCSAAYQVLRFRGAEFLLFTSTGQG